MALTFEYRQAVKHRRRRWRRLQVGMFFAAMALGLSEAGHSWTTGVRLSPYLWVFTQLLTFRKQPIPVSSLDDRAMAEFGVEFERLGEEDQENLLGRYRVGRFLLGDPPDEFEEALERESYRRAHVALRWVLPILFVRDGLPAGTAARGAVTS